MLFCKINKEFMCKERLQPNQCRTCYNATAGLTNLSDPIKWTCNTQHKSYAELICAISKINIMEESNKVLPQFICDNCSRKLKAAHAFIQQIHEVNERLLAILSRRKETENQLDCLQEAQVDIELCLEIKLEQGVTNVDNETGADSHLHQKIEESDILSQNTILDEDILCEDSFEPVALKKRNNDFNTCVNGENMFNADSAQDAEPKPVLMKINGDDEISSVSAAARLDNDVEPDLEEQTISVNSKRKENKALKKIRKSKERIGKLSVDDDVAVPCCQCNKIFSNSKALVRHQRTSHIPEDKKCTCPLCFRKFSRSCNMYTHMRTFHGPDTVSFVRKRPTQERIFQCDKCPRNYTKKKHLNIHIKNKHNQENESIEKNEDRSKEYKSAAVGESGKPNKPKRYEVPSLCSICGSSFSSKTQLVVHMRRHTGERPFKCDLCDRAYPRISELTCHRRIHTGEKPFACKICGKTFRVSSKMTTHMRSHTDIRPYKCNQCERSFKYSRDLSIHFRIHTGERPYKCNVCGNTFTQSNTLKAHRVKLGHMENILENTNKLI